MNVNLKPLWAVGLESDAAISGIDIAFIQTDGVDIYERRKGFSRPYSPVIRDAIRSVLGQKGQENAQYFKQVEDMVTQEHIKAVRELMESLDISPRQIDVIGFPGHTVLNKPEEKISIQIGNAQQMLDAFGIPVVHRFYQTDLLSGGQGSPIFPVYYEALSRDLQKPLVVFSIGGISSLMFIGTAGELVAFDVGPGNTLIDLWMQKKLGAEMDFDGLYAAKGKVNERILHKLMQHKCIQKKPPKALDRTDFEDCLKEVEGCSVEDGSATLTAFTCQALVQACQTYLPCIPTLYVVVGGGACNPSIVKYLKQYLNAPVKVADEIGWSTMCIDAESFAFFGST